ncbi:MAG: hypothetical protein WD802_04445 [Gemmatimonadaceae bacterium]
MADQYHLVFFPYIALGGVSELQVGRATIWNFDSNPNRIADGAIKTRVAELLQMYREPGRLAANSTPIRNIGIVTLPGNGFRPLTQREADDVQELRSALFLCSLAKNTRISSLNGGFMVFTAENFDVVRQNFVLGDDNFAESSGVLVRMTKIGRKIGEVSFTRPAYINSPTRFAYDETLLGELRFIRRRNRALYRRIMNATGVFLESYYNNPTVDFRARVLLQAAAFEMLLELRGEARRAFKSEIERLLSKSGERKFRYKYQVWDKKVSESRTLKAIWADRFFTLRNHVIHGDAVHPNEYVFRNAQHHLVVAPLMFIMCVKQLINEWRTLSAKPRVFFERIDWRVIREADGYDPEERGFQITDDIAARFGFAEI